LLHGSGADYRRSDGGMLAPERQRKLDLGPDVALLVVSPTPRPVSARPGR